MTYRSFEKTQLRGGCHIPKLNRPISSLKVCGGCQDFAVRGKDECLKSLANGEPTYFFARGDLAQAEGGVIVAPVLRTSGNGKRAPVRRKTKVPTKPVGAIGCHQITHLAHFLTRLNFQDADHFIFRSDP